MTTKRPGIFGRSVASSPSENPGWSLMRSGGYQFYLEVFWQGLAVGGVCYYLPVFLVRMGATPFQMSLFSGLPALAVFLFSIPAAMFVEGRKDLVRVTNLFRLSNISTYLLIAMVPFVLVGGQAESGVWVIVALWGLTGIAMAFTPPAWTSVYTEVVPAERRPSINGVRFALFNMASAGGVALFGILLDRLPFPGNYQIVFVLSFAAGVMSILHLTRVRLPGGAFAHAHKATGSLKKRVTALGELFKGNRDFSRYTLAVFIYRLVLALPAGLFTIYWVRELGASDAWIGYRSTAGYATQMLAYFVLGKVASRWGFRALLYASTAGLGLYPILTAAAGSPEWLVPAAIVGSFFTAGLDITMFEGMLAYCRPEKRASSVAINNAVGNAASFIGPMLGIAVAELVGFRPAFYMAGVLTLAGSALFYLLGTGRSGYQGLGLFLKLLLGTATAARGLRPGPGHQSPRRTAHDLS